MEITDALLEEIDPEQLPHPYHQFVGAVGIKGALLIAEQFGGTYVYFPKVEGAIRKARDKLIQKEFDGTNYKQLARKYKLSESWIREIVDTKDENQLEMPFG